MSLVLLLPLLLTPPASAKAPKRAASSASEAHAEPAAEAAAEPVAAPAVPRFARMEVPGCGCALYAPSGLAFDPPTKSEDGSDVWTGEAAVDRWHFGAVVVKFAVPMQASTEAAPGDDMEALLISYMDFLKTQLSITSAAGVGRGHTHAENPSARGVIDYWEDKDGDHWAVKGWVDADRLAVMFVYGPGDYPYLTAQQLYLDGFRFQP